MKITSIIPILAITRQRLGHLRQFPSRITGRDRSLQFLQIGFEKRVGDDQRLDRLASAAASAMSGGLGRISVSDPQQFFCSLIGTGVFIRGLPPLRLISLSEHPVGESLAA
jgi:hypothetical protein